MHIVELKILPRSYMRDAVGIFLGKFGKGFQLIGVQSACGNLDALHPRRIPQGIGPFSKLPGGIGGLLNRLAIVSLTVIVPLAIGASAKPRFSEEALLQLALFAQRDFRLENVDFTAQSFRHFAGELLLPE